MNRDSDSGDTAITAIARLSSKEIKCLELVASGLGSKEIARQVGASHHTIDARLKSACAKLGTKSRFHAASIFREARLAQSETTSPDTKLVYEDRTLPEMGPSADKGMSAGEGDGPGDLRTGHAPEGSAGASRSGRSWLEPSHPLAIFLGGENRLRVGQRIFAFSTIAIGAAIAVGILASALVGISRLVSSP